MDSDDDFYDDCEMDSDSSCNSDEATYKIKVPPFETLKPEEIVSMMNQYIYDVQSVVELPATTIRILLSHTKWDKQELLDRLTDDASDQFLKDAHVPNPFETKSDETKRQNRSNVKTKVTCSICYTDLYKAEAIGLGCDHEFCEDCWRLYLNLKIEDGEAESIRCPAEKCDTVVDDVTIMTLVSDEKIRQKYQHLMTNSFVEHNHSLRWCVAPGCTFAVRANDLLAYRQNCTCECGHSMCFNCGDDTHDPIPCLLMSNWKKNDNDKTIEYLLKFAKSCPKCKSMIEKNGGCNHMTCRKCAHEFCWMCFGNWKGHGSACNAYQPSKDEQNDQKRWEHYFKRYGAHKNSLISEQRHSGDIITKMNTMQELGKTFQEVQFLKNAFEVLLESRKQLMFTYIFAFFVQKHHQKVIFEVNQGDLELATEELSRSFEEDMNGSNMNDLMIQVKNKATYCEVRQKVMQEHIFDGFEQHWWVFSSGA